MALMPDEAPSHRQAGDFRTHTLPNPAAQGLAESLQAAYSNPAFMHPRSTVRPAPPPRRRHIREDGCHRHPGARATPPPGERYESNIRQRKIVQQMALEKVPLQLAKMVPHSARQYKDCFEFNTRSAMDRSFTKDKLFYERDMSEPENTSSLTALIAEHHPNFSCLSKDKCYDHTIGHTAHWCTNSSFGKAAHNLHCKFAPQWPGKAAAHVAYPLKGTMPKQLSSHWNVGSDHFNMIRGPTGEPQAKNSNFLPEPVQPKTYRSPHRRQARKSPRRLQPTRLPVPQGPFADPAPLRTPLHTPIRQGGPQTALDVRPFQRGRRRSLGSSRVNFTLGDRPQPIDVASTSGSQLSSTGGLHCVKSDDDFGHWTGEISIKEIDLGEVSKSVKIDDCVVRTNGFQRIQLGDVDEEAMPSPKCLTAR